jgi:hypothetical protein
MIFFYLLCRTLDLFSILVGIPVESDLQTWSVHMRSPIQLWRDSGARGFFTLNIIVGGNVLTALVHPVLLADVLLQLVKSVFGSDTPSLFLSQFASLHIATIAAGYLSTVAVAVIGLSRRGLLKESWVLVLTPIFWIYLSIAGGARYSSCSVNPIAGKRRKIVWREVRASRKRDWQHALQ